MIHIDVEQVDCPLPGCFPLLKEVCWCAGGVFGVYLLVGVYFVPAGVWLFKACLVFCNSQGVFVP